RCCDDPARELLRERTSFQYFATKGRYNAFYHSKKPDIVELAEGPGVDPNSPAIVSIRSSRYSTSKPCSMSSAHPPFKSFGLRNITSATIFLKMLLFPDSRLLLAPSHQMQWVLILISVLPVPASGRTQ